MQNITCGSRRSFLKTAIGSVVALSARSVLGAPAVLRPELTPQQFGATGGDPVADTLGWNRAMAAAAESGRPIIAKGTYVLRVTGASTWNYKNRPTWAARMAVPLRSGVHVYGKNSEILIAQSDRPPEKNEEHMIFGTEKNFTPGTLKDIRFEGINIDFREEFGPINSHTYAFGAFGVDNFQRHDMVIRASGKQAGRGLFAINTRGRHDRNLKLLNLEQGIFTHYENGVTMEDIEMDGFNEGFDFDGPAWDVTLRRLKFRNSYRTGECIDTGGGARWMVSDVDAEMTGTIIQIYNKTNAYPTCEEWFNSEKWENGQGIEVVTPNFVIPENFTVKSVRGRKIGKGHGKGTNIGKEESARIGSYRMQGTHGYFPGHPVRSPKDITFEDWVLNDCYGFYVNDCENVTLRDITMMNVKTPDQRERGAAMVFHEASLELGGNVTGQVTDIHIGNSDGMGVSVVAGPGLELKDITVDGFDLKRGRNTAAAVRIRHRIGGGPEMASITGLSAKNGPEGVAALDVETDAPELTENEKHRQKTGGRWKPKSREKKPQKIPASPASSPPISQTSKQ